MFAKFKKKIFCLSKKKKKNSVQISLKVTKIEGQIIGINNDNEVMQKMIISLFKGHIY